MTQKKTQKSNTPRFPGWMGVLFLFILIAAAITILANPAGQAIAFPAEINIARAAELRDQGAFVLDVRQPEEWDELRVPGATLIPLDQLSARISEVPQERDIVVICRSGNRSQTGRDILRQAGFENVTSVSGGIIAWHGAGLPTVSGP